jgi:choline/glycine/proline betaine transport protein
MSVFGGSAIELIQGGEQAFGEAVASDQPLGLFLFLDYMPGTMILSVLSLAMIIIFFVTSADSGALVLNMMASGGVDDTPPLQRVLWTAIIAAVSATLLINGGLDALQTATIASALPFSFVLLGALWGLQRSLRSEVSVMNVRAPASFDSDSDTDWQSRLKALLKEPSNKNVLTFQREVVLPALGTFATELSNNGVNASVIDTVSEEGSVELTITAGDEIDFCYSVKLAPQTTDSVVDIEGEALALPLEGSTSVTEVHLRGGSASYCVWGLTESQIIGDVLAQYEQHRRT